jgi:hypothetical protein
VCLRVFLNQDLRDLQVRFRFLVEFTFILYCSTFFFSQKKKVAKKSCVFLK